MDSNILVPQLDFPLRLAADGTFAVVEQDSVDDVANNVMVLLNTAVGEREELPEYGIPDPTFEDGIDVEAINDAIKFWESRARVTLEPDIDTEDELYQHIRTTVEVTDG